MSNLESLLKRIEDAERKATKRPWHMMCAFGSKDLPTAIAHGDGSRTILEWTEESNSSVYDVRFLLEAANNIEKLVKIIKIQQEALEDANEHIKCNMENMKHYYDNKCCPTFDEVGQVELASLDISSCVKQVERLAGE